MCVGEWIRVSFQRSVQPRMCRAAQGARCWCWSPSESLTAAGYNSDFCLDFCSNRCEDCPGGGREEEGGQRGQGKGCCVCSACSAPAPSSPSNAEKPRQGAALGDREGDSKRASTVPPAGTCCHSPSSSQEGTPRSHGALRGPGMTLRIMSALVSISFSFPASPVIPHGHCWQPPSLPEHFLLHSGQGKFSIHSSIWRVARSVLFWDGAVVTFCGFTSDLPPAVIISHAATVPWPLPLELKFH